MRLLSASLCMCVLATTAARATVIVPAEFSEIVNGSHVIVHGVVSNVESRMVGARRTIESVVTVDVIDAIKGQKESAIAFRVPGGQVGRYRRVMIGAPQFTEGDEIVVFLAGRPPTLPMPFGLNQGVYRVMRAAGGTRVTPLIVEGAAVRGDPARRPLGVEAFAAKVRALSERQP